VPGACTKRLLNVSVRNLLGVELGKMEAQYDDALRLISGLAMATTEALPPLPRAAVMWNFKAANAGSKLDFENIQIGTRQ